MSYGEPEFAGHWYDDGAIASGAAPGLDDPWGLERPPSLGRKVVEALFYITILNSSFVMVMYGRELPLIGGLATTVAAVTALLIQFFQRERLSTSVWFGLVMLMGANVSQLQFELPLVGESLRWMFLWLGQMVMFCYLVRNRTTAHRMLCFFAVVIAFSIRTFANTSSFRLEVNKFEGPSWLANSNDVGHICATFTVTILFWSLQAKKVLRPFLWFMGGTMAVFTLLSISRGGIMNMGCGLLLLVIAALLGRGVRAGGIVFLVVALLVVTQAGYMFAETWGKFEHRLFEEQSIRTKVYSMETLYQLWDTMILGLGPGARTESAGIAAHNSWIYVQMCYGGVTSIPYMIWIVYLGLRVAKMCLAKEYRLATKLEVAALFLNAFIAQWFSNTGYGMLSSMYAFGRIEHLTEPYSRRFRHSVQPSAEPAVSPEGTWPAAYVNA